MNASDISAPKDFKPSPLCTISSRSFGKLSTGETIDEYTLANSSGLAVHILTWGGIIREILTPDKNGVVHDIVLGYGSLAPYETRHPYFGNLTGRFANRIAKGSFSLDGTKYSLELNNPPNHLHGGVNGFDRKVWSASTNAGSDTVSLILQMVSPDGDEGYPGTVWAEVRYTINTANELRIDYTATTTKATPINLTSHSYFNLAGHSSGSIYDHQLQLFADAYLPVDKTLLPLGHEESVRGSAFDFTTPAPIGSRIKEMGIGYDHNFVVRGRAGTLRPVASVWEPRSGRTLEVLSTQPGVQFYTGNYLDREHGKANAVYLRHAGFCLETQNFPDAVNQPAFPSSILRPGERYQHTTIFRFGIQR